MNLTTLALFTVTILSQGQDISTATLLKMEAEANYICRGGPESAETDAWCSVREALADAAKRTPSPSIKQLEAHHARGAALKAALSKVQQ